MITPPAAVSLSLVAEVRTRVIPDPHSLLAGLPERDLTCWVRQGQGMVGFGVAHARTFSSAAQANAWWRDLAGSVAVERDRGLAEEPMAGPVAFISFPFAPDGAFEVVVPQVVVGRRHGLAWATTWGDARWAPDQARTASPPAPRLSFRPGPLDRDRWFDAVCQLVARIRQGQVDKVVLARDELATAAHPIDVRPVLSRLATAYPQTWTFCVANLVGASPELLVRQDGGRIASRVLAGTIPGDRDHTSLAAALSSSSKDLAEHEYAVASVARALRDHVSALHVPDEPFVLRLPNVMHLASDITGMVRDGGSVLQLADLIHPSAAVCGTPTDAARALIGEYEGMDRARYAGPVGWVNADGDGEIALALRCGLIEGGNVRIFAGCGIVADSRAAAEWEETIAKFLPMKQALLAV